MSHLWWCPLALSGDKSVDTLRSPSCHYCQLPLIQESRCHPQPASHWSDTDNALLSLAVSDKTLCPGAGDPTPLHQVSDSFTTVSCVHKCYLASHWSGNLRSGLWLVIPGQTDMFLHPALPSFLPWIILRDSGEPMRVQTDIDQSQARQVREEG